VSTELFVDVSPNELTIALLEDKKLVELRKEQSNVQFAVGDIYLGKVRKILPGLNAAFIDIGCGKDAFLHYLDLGAQFKTLNKYIEQALSKKGSAALHKQKQETEIDKSGTISQVLSVGKDIMVQIAKEPISTKGPRLTAEISIAGRNIILIPFCNKVSVSQKIQSAEERNRLRRLLLSIRPKNYGIIVRTVAEGKKVAELDRELKTLQKRWEDSIARLKEVKAPVLLVSEIGRTSAFLRDLFSPDFQAIYVNDPIVYREMKDYIELISPGHEKIVKLHSDEIPLLDHYGVRRQMKGSFGRIVSVNKGAYLIVEHTEALHVIDVNSGNRSRATSDQEKYALEVNLAAAEEIARQLRLRDMGGIIVIDFIDMQNTDNRQKLFDKMKEIMDLDRTKHNILPLSKFGLMQITRQRVRPMMHIETMEQCPTCFGSGKITQASNLIEIIETNLRFAIEQANSKKLKLWVHPYVYAFIKKGFPSQFLKWQFQLGFRLKLRQLDSMGFLQFYFTDKDNKKIDLSGI